MNIKILGGGCASCKKLYENTLKAVEEKGLVAEVEHITDMPKVMEYGVMSMPVLVVEEKIAAQGKVLKTTEIVKLLGKMGF